MLTRADCQAVQLATSLIKTTSLSLSWAPESLNNSVPAVEFARPAAGICTGESACLVWAAQCPSAHRTMRSTSSYSLTMRLVSALSLSLALSIGFGLAKPPGDEAKQATKATSEEPF